MTTPAPVDDPLTGRSPSGPPTINVGLPVLPVMAAVGRRPDLWSTALRAAVSMAPAGWWRRRPFLPMPDPEWLRFRMSTAYGGDGHVGPNSDFDTDDLITWLEWRKAWPA